MSQEEIEEREIVFKIIDYYDQLGEYRLITPDPEECIGSTWLKVIDCGYNTSGTFRYRSSIILDSSFVSSYNGKVLVAPRITSKYGLYWAYADQGIHNTRIIAHIFGSDFSGTGLFAYVAR